MSKKHFDQYYNNVVNQHKQLLNLLQQTQKQFENKLIAPQKYDEIKKTIEPLLTNYTTLTWVKFLLDKPNRNRKQKDYELRNKKIIKQCQNRTQEKIKQQNENVLKNVKQQFIEN